MPFPPAKREVSGVNLVTEVKVVIDKMIVEKLLSKLKSWYKSGEWWRNVDYTPFEIVVAIIVSQRTYYKQVIRFMETFRARYKSPEDVCEGSTDELIAVCRVVGMAERRAATIRELSRKILSVSGMKNLLKLSPEKARELLLSVKGIGEKTADMILVALFGSKYFIVDCNILRVLRRLGIIPTNIDIYRARKELEPFIPSEHRVFLHTSLVSLGQKICRPRNPVCTACPLNKLCDYARKTVAHDQNFL